MHNPVAKIIYDEVLAEHCGMEDHKVERYRPPAQVTKVKDMEIWWDYQFKALTKLPHKRPDIVIWNTGKRECIIVDVCVPLDTNVELRE